MKANITNPSHLLVVAILAGSGMLCRADAQQPASATAAGGQPSVVAQPAALVELLVGDMTLAHEAPPQGVLASYGWDKAPRVGAGNQMPADWHAVTMWGQIYVAEGGSPAVNVRVQVKDLVLLYLSKKDGQWHQLQRDPKANGAAYREDFANDGNQAADIRQEADGTASVRLVAGHNYHFWPTASGPARATVDSGDIAGLVSAFKARMVVADAKLPDDRAKARIMGSCGGDYWRDLDCKWKADWSNNCDWALGRFRFLTNEWQIFTACTVGREVLAKLPPPLEWPTAAVKPGPQ